MTECERWGHALIVTFARRWLPPWRKYDILRCWRCDLYLPEPP